MMKSRKRTKCEFKGFIPVNLKVYEEASRSELVGKSRSQDKMRYNRRLAYRPVTFSGVNLNELFNNDDLVFTTDVGGYTDIVAVKGVLNELKSILKGKLKCTYADVLRAINNCLDRDGIRISCGCDDFCLTRDTKISLLDGRELSVLEIVDEFNKGNDLWVYSTDSNGDFKPGKITDAWKTGISDNLYEITLNNGEVVRCTGNHPFMLRDRSYKNAEDLVVGQSLMPLYRRVGSRGYEQVLINSSTIKSDYRSTYKLVANELYSDEINRVRGETGETPQIHHKDFNKSNNSPENLRIMTRMDHWRLHSTHAIESGAYDKMHQAALVYWRSSEGRKVKSECMSKSIRSWWNSLSDEEKHEHAMKCRNGRDDESYRASISLGRKRFYDSMTPEERSEYTRKSINSEESIKKAAITRSKTMKQQYSEGSRVSYFSVYAKLPRSSEWKSKCSEWMSKSMKIRMSDKDYAKSLSIRMWKVRVMKVLTEMSSKGIPLTETNFSNFNSDKYSKVPRKWWKYYESWDDVLDSYSKLNNNHYVRSIRKLDGFYEIYDITVDKWHNFLLSAGVVVSNTYRYKHWAYKGGYLYGDPGKAVEAPKYDRTNREGRGSMCKHLASVLSRKEWIVKVAAAINNYIRLNVPETAPYLYDNPDEVIEKNKKARKSVTQTQRPVDDTQGQETTEPEDTQTDSSSDEFDDKETDIVDDTIEDEVSPDEERKPNDSWKS